MRFEKPKKQSGRFATPCYSLKRTSLLSVILGVTFGISLIGAPRLAAEDNCQPTSTR